VIVVVEVSV
jgi:hypothetical protein